MIENVPKRRMSMITDIAIFFVITSMTIYVFNHYYKSRVDYSYYVDNNKISLNSIVSNKRQIVNIEAENKMYIKNIKDEYGIKIKYGNDIIEFTEKVDAIPQYDSNVINNNLKIIYKALEKYPDEVFDMTRSKKYPITVMIVDKFNNDNLALAAKNSLNEFRLYISNTENFERAFHHEMYHLLEYYMSDTKKYLYASWNSFNPSDFKYEKDISKLTDDYVYNNDEVSESLVDESSVNIEAPKDENPYFVSKYSKVTEKEDRAEIFAEMMICIKKPKYLNKDQNIRKKAEVMNDTIKKNITNSNFFYTRYF